MRACIGAAFSVDAEGEERLVLVHEMNPRTQAEAGAVIAAVHQAIAEEHELQVYAIALTRPGEIPRTTSGKIQRFLCRNAFLAGDMELLGDWRAALPSSASEMPRDGESQADDWQTWLILQLARRLRISPEMIEADRSPSRYGLDSLAAVEVAHEIEQKTSIALPFADLISGLSVAELAAALCLRKELAATGITTGVMPRRHDAAKFPLSHGQSALFFFITWTARIRRITFIRRCGLRRPWNRKALARAFRLLVRRHPRVRNRFQAGRRKTSAGSPARWRWPHLARMPVQ